MKLTRKACYGLRSLLYIASRPTGRFCSVEEIGRAEGLPEDFLAKVLGELVRAGLLVSRRGQEGGLRLARPASEITLLDIIDGLEGPLAISECLRPYPDCPWIENCRMHQIMVDLQETIRVHLGSVCLASSGAEELVSANPAPGP